MPALICGSLAFDTITNFPGRFAQQIMPDKVHMLNVSFLVPTMRREYGGCAGNIAYSLHLLGGQPLVMAALGNDGGDYLQRLQAWGLDTSQVLRADDTYTAQCMIITDQDNNQITAFHPGAMQLAHNTAVPAARGDIGLAIIAPDGRDAMLSHAAQLAAAKIPFVFDPGQGLPMFDGDELKSLVHAATALTVNDYEFGLMLEKTGWSEAEMAQAAGTMIVTRGAEGSQIHANGRVTTVAPVAIARAIDPTGCGDAYRGGLLYGLAEGWDWERSARLGSVMGAIKIESQGPQNHRPTRDEIADRFAGAYGSRPW